jgi:hypothetical protein
MKKLLFLSCLVLAVSGNVLAQEDQDINFIGLDEAGKEIEIPMKKRIWNERTKEVLRRLGGETLAGLSHLLPSGEKFDFYQFDLGAEVKMKVGIGELVEATVQPYFYLVFKK